ncbi:MAG: hypothetical protein ACRDID_11125, partial [Ktedonobacterales bacterium]
MDSPIVGGPPAPRRRSWLIVAAGLLALALCVAIIAITLGPLALRRLTGGRPISLQPSAPLVCPQARASDSVPHDASGQFNVQPVYSEVLS